MPKLTIEEKLIYRNIKRAAIIWLLLLRLDPQPVTEAIAADILNIDRSTARKYLKDLAEVYICTRLGRYNGYILTQSGRQLGLPFELQSGRGEIPPSDVNDFNNESKKEKDLNTSLLLINGEGGNSTFEGEKTTFATIDVLIEDLLKSNPDKENILNALLEVGISMNGRTIKLLYADDITPHDIKSQYAALKDRGLEDQTGILIVNLESKFRAKGASIDPDTGHKTNCRCNDCILAWNKRTYEDWNND